MYITIHTAINISYELYKKKNLGVHISLEKPAFQAGACHTTKTSTNCYTFKTRIYPKKIKIHEFAVMTNALKYYLKGPTGFKHSWKQ